MRKREKSIISPIIPKPLGFFIISLIIVNIVYFIGLFSGRIDRVIREQWLFRLDFRYWPFEATYVLWFIFVWLLIDAVTFRQRKRPFVDEQGRANSVRSIVFVLKLLVVAAFAVLLVSLRIRWIHSLFLKHYFAPMTQFFYDGSLSWKLLLPPLSALLVIGFLLRLRKVFQVSKHRVP